MKYGYARVATTGINSTNLDEQKEQLIKAGADVIYSEVGSGNQINTQLQILLNTIKDDDTLIIRDSSRLGRDDSTLHSAYRSILSKNAKVYNIASDKWTSKETISDNKMSHLICELIR